MQKCPRICLLFFCLSFFSHNSVAFENFEHKAIGNIAFAFAKYLTPSCIGKDTSDPACKYLDVPASDKKLTYGDIAQCVDRFLTPEKLIARLRYEINKPLGEKEKQDSSAFPNSLYREESKCKSDGLNQQAAHNNHAHFQEELLVSLATYHSLAMMIARNNPQENLGRALVVNAIADHYLHDFFAPGHIVTRRNELTDTVALAMHDYRNERGAMFYVNDDRKKPSSNSSVLDTLTQIGCLLGNEGADCKFKKIDTEKSDLFLCQLLSHPQRASCVAPIQVTEGERESVLKAIKAIIGSGENEERKDWVCMLGDNNLWNMEPTTSCKINDTLSQRLLMVAANVTSIREVIQESSISINAPSTTLTEFSWKYDSHTTGDDSAYAALSFGTYSMGKAGQLPDEYKIAISANQTGTQNKKMPRQDITRENFNFENIYRVSLARESFFKGDHVGRWAETIEIQPAWYRAKSINYGIGFGLVKAQEKDVQAGGGVIRALITIADTESSFSLWGRRMYHGGNAEHGWRNGVGFGYEQGFTSMFSLNIGVGKDYGALPGGNLKQGTLFFGGVSFTWPENRLRNYLNDNIEKPTPARKDN